MQEDLLLLATKYAGYMPGFAGYISSGFSIDMLAILIIVWLLGVFICRCFLTLKSSVVVVSIKTGIVLIYFVYFANGQWFTGGDTWGYVLKGIDLLIKDVDPIKIWFVQEGQSLYQFENAALGKWYNFTLFYFFGVSYYAGVFFFTVISAITGGFVYLLLIRSGEQTHVARLGTIFFLLHWETVTWTSFLNIKEPLITLFLFATIYCFSILPTRPVRSLIGLTAITLVYQKLRFYMPFLLFVGYFTTLLSTTQQFSKKTNYLWTITIVIIFSAAILSLDIVSVSQIRYALSFADWSYFPLGLAKVILSPLPWRITEPASYLYVSSVLHILLLPITCLGGYLLWTKGYVGRLIVIIYVVGLVAYALQPVVNSPRHRAPFLALEILMQLEFFYWAFRPTRSVVLVKRIQFLLTR